MKKIILILVVLFVIFGYIYAKKNIRIIRFVDYDPQTRTGLFRINGKEIPLRHEKSPFQKELFIGAGLILRDSFDSNDRFEGWLLVNEDDIVISHYYIERQNERAYIHL